MKSKMNYPCAFIRNKLHCAYDDKDIFGTLYISRITDVQSTRQSF